MIHTIRKMWVCLLINKEDIKDSLFEDQPIKLRTVYLKVSVVREILLDAEKPNQLIVEEHFTELSFWT